MERYFLEQRDKLEQNETPTDQMIETLNSEVNLNGKWLMDFGLDVANPDAHADKPGKSPQVFVLKDGKISSLSESNIKPGSREFWESAMKGQLFGYRAGEKNPVQLQAYMGCAGLKCDTSSPLEPGKEGKFPSEPEVPKAKREPVKPEYPKIPTLPELDEVAKPGNEPPRPGFFTRLGAAFGIKSSINRIATHTAWVNQSAEYEKYQTAKQEQEKKRKQYEADAQRKYAKAMQTYNINVAAARIQGAGNRGIVETYELEHAAWKKDVANKESLSEKREQSAKMIADALGETRSDDVLEAEKQEAEERKKYCDHMRDRIHVQRGIENMLSMYGATPYVKEDFVKNGRYASKDIELLSKIDLNGLTVGSKSSRPITNEDFGGLAMFAMVTPENGKKMSADNSPPIVDYEGTVKAYKEVGFNEEELGELLANQYVGVVTTDVLRNDYPRGGMSIAFKEYVEPARKKTLQALQEYQNGNKQPLADIISRGMEYTDLTARASDSIDECTAGLLVMANRMVDMMERDPVLKTMAAKSFEQRETSMCSRHKEFQPRTMNDLIKNVKAHEKLQDMRQKSAEAKVMLERNQAGKLDLTDQQKKDCLRDVMKCNTVNEMYKAQVTKLNLQGMEAIDPISNRFEEKYGSHESLSMLSDSALPLLQSRYMNKTPDEKSPPMLEVINSKKSMQTLDTMLDKMIENDMKKEGISLDQVCKKAIDFYDRTYSGRTLAGKMKEELTFTPEPTKDAPKRQVEQPKLEQTKGLTP